MIDWMVSKIVMSILAVGLIVVSFAFFSDVLREDHAADVTMQDIADRVAEKIDQIGSFQGEIRQNVTFKDDPSATGLNLPIHLEDEEYRISFTQGSVSVERLSETRSSDLSVSVHLFGPDELPDNEITSERLREKDREHRRLSLGSGTGFVIENVPKIVDGEYLYVTLLYEDMSL